MRVSTSMIQRLAVGSILDRQADLSKTQLQLASGKKILTPSEDPAGTTQALRFNEAKNVVNQYQSNANMAKSRLETEEGALIAIGDSLQRLRELAVQGLNGSLGQENRAAIAEEVRQRLDELKDLANATDGTGEYLFSGFQSKTPPVVDGGGGTFTYQGDQGQRELQISATRKVGTSDNGFDLFFNVPFSGGGTQNILTTVYNFATDLDANAPTDDILTDLETAMGQVLTVRAKVGARMNTLDSQMNINEQYTVQLDANLSDIQDLDYAEAVGRLNLQLAGLQASQQSFQRIQNLSLFNFL